MSNDSKEIFILKDYETASKLALEFSKSIDEDDNGAMDLRKSMAYFIGWMFNKAHEEVK